MNEQTAIKAQIATAPTHVDVLIVGAGISGIGAAYHLGDQRPGTSYLILETQEKFGGTWRTHTYPGVRSDSDLYTFGYRFKPWTGKPTLQLVKFSTTCRKSLTKMVSGLISATSIRF